MENQTAKQIINHRSYLRKFHKILSGKRSLARSAFNSLKPGQKLLLMKAAGIQQRTTMIYNSDGSKFKHVFAPDYGLLSDDELDSLRIGLQRLQSIIDAFALCEDEDFKKEIRRVA